MFRNASFYLLALFIVIVAGFWPSYFSVPFGETRLSLHIHGISMMLWLSLLVVQPWLIRTGRNQLHRLLGKSSLLVMPVLLATGFVVSLEDYSNNYADPFSADALGILFLDFGFLVPLLLFYVMAIYHRKNVRLHARYMLSTAQFLIIPGVFRLYMQLAPTDDWGGVFFNSLLVASVIPVALIIYDKVHGKIYPPFVYLALAWAINLLGFKLIHHFDGWHSFAAWALTLGF